MSLLKSKLAMLTSAILHPSALASPFKYLIILSHMRSRSSVFSHVLGSSEDICGYRELHNSYQKSADLLKMRVKLSRDLKEKPWSKYLLDKVLLDSHCVSPSLLKRIQCKPIFLIREPTGTIESIMTMGYLLNNPAADWLKNPELATQYYISRLATLKSIATELHSYYCFVESGDLISHTDQVLASLSEWLGLDSALTSEYNNFAYTGKSHHGDPSQNIRSGRIITTERPKGRHAELALPCHLKEIAQDSYERCRGELIAHAAWIAGQSLAPLKEVEGSI